MRPSLPFSDRLSRCSRPHYRSSEREALAAKVSSSYPTPGAVVCIDFTHPSAVNANAEWYAAHKLPFVMGTTGGDREALMTCVEDAGLHCVIAPNMAKQIVALQAALEHMAGEFPGSFEGYALRVVESHQSTKADTSGTAKAISASLAKLNGDETFGTDSIEKVRPRPAPLCPPCPSPPCPSLPFPALTLPTLPRPDPPCPALLHPTTLTRSHHPPRRIFTCHPIPNSLPPTHPTPAQSHPAPYRAPQPPPYPASHRCACLKINSLAADHHTQACRLSPSTPLVDMPSTPTRSSVETEMLSSSLGTMCRAARHMRRARWTLQSSLLARRPLRASSASLA